MLDINYNFMDNQCRFWFWLMAVLKMQLMDNLLDNEKKQQHHNNGWIITSNTKL